MATGGDDVALGNVKQFDNIGIAGFSGGGAYSRTRR